MIAGSAEAREGSASYSERIIRRGDVSAPAMREKAQYVLGEMERRLTALGFGWADTTATQVYTVHDLHPFLADEIVRRGAARSGLTWHYARPPVRELEYEMDCRAVARERVGRPFVGCYPSEDPARPVEPGLLLGRERLHGRLRGLFVYGRRRPDNRATLMGSAGLGQTVDAEPRINKAARAILNMV